MADMVTTAAQEVAAASSVTFATNRVWTRCPNIQHEPASARVTLLPGLYRVAFSANLTSTADVEAIIEIRQDGEAIPGAVIHDNLTAAEYTAVSATVEVRVGSPCCSNLSVYNNSADAVTFEDANLVINRIG